MAVRSGKAEAAEVGRVHAATEATFDATGRQDVEGGELGGQAHRVVQGGQQDRLPKRSRLVRSATASSRSGDESIETPGSKCCSTGQIDS